MMRSSTRKRRLVSLLRRGRYYFGLEDDVASLPVTAKDEVKKNALVRALKVFSRQETALYQRARALAEMLERLPVENKLLK